MKHSHLRRPATLALALGLAACSQLLSSCQQQQLAADYPGYKMAPYTVKGVHYVPMSVDQALHYRAEGIASHYEADGRRGAIGQKLYEGCLYAAHRTLPLPCVVRITNLSNGRSCKARVADRGPFINNRLIDVSSEVAHRLGFHSKGLDRVRVEVLSVGDGPWKRTL
ncbi:MAG TPA: septal ring lytic transglycosylase RlpA family protein [Candidatus Akkermansia intestinigallinarum]|uniref:Probable endolytic peptidoglycan transglycosylase RlpA n=1 Tax=Candidatus Akkermansia intestinigallinarum TaxID=2838431 RepID=A0A9D2AGQ0_9BACT|nr:septal ring lytic transglycosylase RlpA family protein [Candidatus Akkermansia intestinigallinarum]